MRQEIAWFDLQQQAAITTTFEIDSMTYQLAIGEKISSIIMVLSMLTAGIGISFYLGWILTLVILAYIPVIIIVWTKSIAIKVETGHEEDQVYRESDAKAQESLSAIKMIKQMNS
jgi:ATP-binding cassette, subfamily B (MDR/TAP), member 1